MSRSRTDFQPSLLGRHTPVRLCEFWVITCYFNPCRYENRFKNYLKFARNLRAQHVNLLTVELCAGADGDLSGDVCDRYVRIAQSDVLWAKERLLNVALQNLPAACTQVCWCDCDVLFQRPSWARLCSELLKRHRVVQPFATAIFLGPDETPERHTQFRPSVGFARFYVHDMRGRSLINTEHVLASHPGYAWAARRDVLERIGRFYDKCILGHGDIVMGLAACHSVARDGPIPDEFEPGWRPGWSDALTRDIREWQRGASAVIDGDVTYVQGEVFHLWHGPRRNRNYDRRGALIQDFDPKRHLEPGDETSMWRWTEEAKRIGLDARCLAYFKQRREDDKRVT